MSKLEVVVTNNGKVITRMDSDSFMTVGKQNFGIGRNRFLGDYVAKYNELYPENKAEIRIIK